MKQLTVISGKGGTGKTMLSAAFAVLATRKVLADCDVDAANLHLLLHPRVQKKQAFVGGRKAVLQSELCNRCGTCLEACRFEAIRSGEGGAIKLDPLACEGCGVCSRICPANAIQMHNAVSGEWRISHTPYGPFVHARLDIGAENSGKLVTEVRKRAQEEASRVGAELIIIDGPPGIGCPVIASLTGTDLALVVTEPTPSGLQDMERVIGTARHFQIRTACCINKYDVYPPLTHKIQRWCDRHDVALVGRIPFDSAVMDALVAGVPLPEFTDNPTARAVRDTWEGVYAMLQGEDAKT